MTRRLDIAAAEALAASALARAGANAAAAQAAGRALVLAERDDLPSHGLSRVTFYAAQLRSGKIAGDVSPSVETDGAVVRVDARAGLAFPAIDAGIGAGLTAARDLGLAALSVANSHHFGVASHPVERIAEAGMIGLAFSNSPAAMAPWGGRRPLYGTNPVAFAAPRRGHLPLVIDLSLSHVARGKVMLAQKAGRDIPEGWALDAEGNPTTDATAAMAGTMVPAGGAKGAALALMVELLCAGLSGGHFAFEASSLFSAAGTPPKLGHLILILDPARFAGDFTARAEIMFAAIAEDPEARLPGARRAGERAARAAAIDIPEALAAELEALAAMRPADN